MTHTHCQGRPILTAGRDGAFTNREIALVCESCGFDVDLGEEVTIRALSAALMDHDLRELLS